MNFIVCEFLSCGNCNPFTRYVLALVSHRDVHYNGSLVIVFEIEIFTKT